MSSAVSISNIVWGVACVWVARLIYGKWTAKVEDRETQTDDPQTMKNTQIDISGPSVVPRGPYVA